MIEWNNSALCIPRKCVSKAALITADIDSISTEKKLEEVIDLLADFICKWNTKYHYKDNSKNKEKEGNCQDFCSELLDALLIKPDHLYTGALGLFLKRVREEGKSEMIFTMEDEFRETFQIKEKRLTFHTHKELDQFVQNCMTKEVEFELKYKSEWTLLKSFDRAFWLRYYKFKDDPKFQPLGKEIKSEDGDVDYKICCPFGDPEETGSLRFTKSEHK